MSTSRAPFMMTLVPALVVLLAAPHAGAAPCEAVASWRLAPDVARTPGTLEAVAALAVWGPTASYGWFEALATADRGGLHTAVAIDGRVVTLTLTSSDSTRCALADRLANERQEARWTDDDATRTTGFDLAQLAPTRDIPAQALIGRAALGTGPTSPFSMTIEGSAPPVPRPGRRTEDAPRFSDGRAHLVLAWPIAPDDVGLAVAAAADLAHPGGPLASRLMGAHGAADVFEATVTRSPLALVVRAVTRDTRDAKDRILRELEAYEIDPRPATLAAYPAARDAVMLERYVRRLARVPPSEIVQAAPPNAAPTTANTDDAWLFVRASIDLRCPAPGENRASAELLEEKHGLDAARYLALSRLLGRDPDRFQGIDLEIRDRCAERAKLQRLLAPAKVVALYQAHRCLRAATANERRQAELALFKRYDLDPSALGPLVALVRDEPQFTRAIEDIEARCPAP